MSAPASTAGVRLVQHLREPMHRSAYALILGSAATSGLGYLFWIVAARRFDADVVGTATAMIASMGFLANVATLGLRGGLVRFLPTAGAGATALVRRSYLICGVAAAVAAGVFLLGQPLWAEDLELLRGSAAASAVFVCATVAWVIMVLQESVLTGLHRATWVPVSSTAYSGIKILLLVAAVGTSAWSVFAAYALPAVLVLVVVNVLVLRSVGRSTTPEPDRTPPPIVGLSRFAAGDHTAAMLWLATTELLPLLVLAEAGPSASAYYYLAFTAGYSFYLVAANIGNALVAEAARDVSRLEELARRAVRNALLLVVPAAGLGVVAAPLVLHLLGKDYAAEATGLLRLVLLSAIPQVIVSVAVSVARVRRRISHIVWIYAATAVLVFGGAEIALRTIGLTGVGVAWLLAQVVVAAGLLVTQMSFLWTAPVGELLVRYGSAGRRALRRTARGREARRIIDAVTDGMGRRPSGHTLLTSDNDTLVAAAVIGGQEVVVKVARSARAAEAVARHARVLYEIGRTPGARAVGHLLPTVVHRGVLETRAYLIETRLPGSPLSRVGEPVGAPPAVTADVARSFDDLYRATAMWTPVTDRLLESVVFEPARSIAFPGTGRLSTELSALTGMLETALSGPRLTVSWTHGDCWLGNVLAERRDGQVRITGLIDWEDARPDGLPDVDLAHLWLTAQGGEIGERLLSALAGPRDGFDRWLVENGLTRPNLHIGSDVVLVLAWLAHVHAGVRRCPPDGPGRVWRRRTVHAVLPRIAALIDPERIGREAP